MRLYPYAGIAGDFMVWNGANNIATYGLVEHRYPVLATAKYGSRFAYAVFQVTVQLAVIVV